jgi:ABC-type hemin transport system ATPase subunit
MATLYDLSLAGQYADTMLLSSGQGWRHGAAAEVLTEETVAAHISVPMCASPVGLPAAR